jgi:hypothetical protein
VDVVPVDVDPDEDVLSDPPLVPVAEDPVPDDEPPPQAARVNNTAHIMPE